MKIKVFSLILALGTLLALQSCGGGAGSIDKDAKPDFTLSAAEFDKQAHESPGQFLGKIVQITGKVVKTHSIASGGDVSHGEHYIHIESNPERGSTVSCFFGEAHDDLMGKEVTVKGKAFKYDITDTFGGLEQCVVVK